MKLNREIIRWWEFWVNLVLLPFLLVELLYMRYNHRERGKN